MNVLIVGGAGFLGGCLAGCLARNGHTVTVVSRRTPPRALQGLRYIQATMDDAAVIALEAAQADYLFLLAWDTTPGTSQLQPTLEATYNILPTLKLLELMQQHPRCRIVFVSTGGAIYADGDGSAFSESSRVAPRSYYGAAKLAVETMLGAYHAQTGNPVLILRPPNVYGPGQLAKRQFGIVPTLMQALRDGSAFEIWGDGEAARDYLYIADLERFALCLVAHSWPPHCHEIINVGSGRSVSVNEICAILERVSGRTLLRRSTPTRRVDASRVALDVSRAAMLLGWSPRTDIEEGLAQTWNWFLGAT